MSTLDFMSRELLSERERLEEYIEGSRRVQRVLVRGSLLGGVGALVATKFDPTVGWSLVATVVFSAGIGFYITGMHIAEWRQRLYDMGHDESLR